MSFFIPCAVSCCETGYRFFYIQSFINKKKLHPYSEWSFVFNVVSEGLVIANDHSVAFTMDIDDGNFLVFAQ